MSIPGPRNPNAADPPIELLDARRLTRKIVVGPFAIRDIKLDGTPLNNARGRAAKQLATVAKMFESRPATEPILRITFAGVNPAAPYEHPGTKLLTDQLPINMEIWRGDEAPELVTDDGLARLVLVAPVLNVESKHRTTDATTHLILPSPTHLILRADGEIRITQS